LADDEQFLARWARRKAEADKKPRSPERPGAPDQSAALEPGPADQPAPDTPAETGEEARAEPAEPMAWEKIDIAALTHESDFSPFMQEGVPDNVRKQALDRLWQSDPMANISDGLNEYDEDYSSWGIAKQVVKSAYKVGQGYLTDEEVATRDAEREAEDKERQVAELSEGDEQNAAKPAPAAQETAAAAEEPDDSETGQAATPDNAGNKA
jgi:hypothetical protein